MAELAAIGITSKDIGASTRFYGLLGVAFAQPEGDGDHVEATLASGVRLMLDSLESVMKFDPERIAPTGHRMELAFECASSAEVDALHAKIVAAGYSSKTAPWDAFWGQRYAQVIDPDANIVSVFAAL